MVLFVAPEREIPPPSAVTSVGVVTAPSSITVSPVQAVCSGGVATVSVSNNPDYNNWTWSPFAEIYSKNFLYDLYIYRSRDILNTVFSFLLSNLGSSIFMLFTKK
jgi:hypothetical protein